MSAVLEECAGKEVGASGFGGVESGEEASCVSSAEKKKRRSLSSVGLFLCR